MLSKYFYLFAFTAILLPSVALLNKPQIAYQEDFIGHVTKAHSQPLNRYLQGWNFEYWSGYNEDLYPNGYHYFLKLFLTRFSDDLAVQLSTLTIIFLQLVALLFAVKAWLPEPQAKLVFAIILIFLTSTDSKYLGNYSSTIFAGAGPASLGLVLFFCAVGLIKQSFTNIRSVMLGGLVIGLSILTHTITAMAVILLFLIKLLFTKSRLRIFESLLLGALVGLPWIWVAINPDFAASRINFAGDSMSLFIPLGLSILTIWFKKSPKLLVIPAILLMFLSSTPAIISDYLQQHEFGGIHFYRFFIFAGSLALLGAAHLIPRRSITLPVLYTLLAISTGLVLQKTTLFNLARIDINQRLVSHLIPNTSRIMDISTDLRNFGVPSAPTYLLTKNTPLIAADGVFFESSPMGILVYSLEQYLSPRGFMLGLDIRLLRKALGESKYPLNETNAADVLGINYVTYASQDPQEAKESTVAGSISHSLTPNLSISLPLYIKPLSQRPLAETLSYLPQPSSQKLTTWWPQANLNNLFRLPAENDPALDTFVATHPMEYQVIPTDLSVASQEIRYYVPSRDKYAPVFVKFNYSPYMSATANGTAVPIAKVSPNYMLVPSRGQTIIRWEFPLPLLVIEKMSLTVLGITATIAAVTFIRNGRFSKSSSNYSGKQVI